MAIKAADLYIEIGAQTKDAEEGLKRVDRGLRDLGEVSRTAIGVALGGALLEAGKGFVGLGAQALDSYAKFERLGASLNQMAAAEALSAGKAKDMKAALSQTSGVAKDLQGWIQKLAIQSPFTSEGVADAYRTAMAYGFTVEQSKRLTQAMIDFSAGSGASEASMSRISLALGQIQAKGKLAGGEMLQLTEAGLNVADILAKAWGKSTAEIIEMREDGLLPAGATIEAITQYLETNFAGAAQKQSNTFAGLIASVEDLKSVGLREFFSATFEEAQPELEKFVGMLQDPATIDNIREMGVQFAKTGKEVVGFAQDAYKWFTDLEPATRGLAIAGGLLALNLGMTAKVIGGIYAVATGLPAVIGAVSSVWTAWNAGLSLTTSLQVGLGAMTVTVGSIVAIVGSVVGIWVAWNENIEKTNRLGRENVANKFGEMFDGLRRSGADAIKVTDQFVKSYDMINKKLNESGIAAVFIDRSKLAKENLSELSKSLIGMGVNYETYNANMMRAAEATGILNSHTYAQIMATGDQARITEWLSANLGILTEEQMLAAQAVGQSDAAITASSARWQAMADAYKKGKDGLAQFNDEAAAGAGDLEAYNGWLEKVRKANEDVTKANQGFAKSLGSDVKGALDNVWLSSDKYMEALAATDDVLGTGFVNQKNMEDSTKALVDNFARTGDIEAYKEGLGKIYDQYLPLNEEVIKAKTEVQKLNTEFSKIPRDIYVKIHITKDGTMDVDSSGYSGSSPLGGEGGNNGGMQQRATGGDYIGNTPLLVGERGPELLFPRNGGYVANANQTRELLNSAGRLEKLERAIAGLPTAGQIGDAVAAAMNGVLALATA